MRKLATIRTVKDIEAIPNADAIEVVVVDGWRVVAKKGQFKPGDKCVFLEIDSFLPIRPEFEFLRKSSYKKFPNGIEGFRLRTIKLRGVISQGLVMPISDTKLWYTPVGRDVTGSLGVQLYEPDLLGQAHKHRSWIVRKFWQIVWPIVELISPRTKRVKTSTFPSLFPKTDEERIQNLDISKFQGREYEITEKIDGTSCTIAWTGEDFLVCSRNHRLGLQIGEDGEPTGLFNGAYWKIAKRFNLEEKMKTLPAMAIQGEIIGPGIQKNKYNRTDFEFFLFKIWLIADKRYATPAERLEIITKLGVYHVPILEEKIFNYDNVDAVLKDAEGMSSIAQTEREGIVFKCVDGSHSFKAISNKFLLKHGE